MKRFHKLIALGLLLFMGVACAACGGENGSGSDDGNGGGAVENPYGSLSIEDVKVYITVDKTYTFAEIDPVFTDPDKAEELTYTYDANDIKIEGNVVTPLKRKDQNYKVTAKSEHFETDFKVEVEYIRWTGEEATHAEYYDLSKYPVATRAMTCKAVNENTTLFLGDSFMDDYFIGDYMKTYAADKEVLNAGMSSTTSYHWERAYKEIIGSTAPKNIVFHIGTNNFYDLRDAEEDTQESLKRLMMYVHASYPTSNIYWFNITQRTNTTYAQSVTETNAVMATWCSRYDWITCVDTCSKISGALLKDDGVHPLTQSYKVFTDALADAGCEIVNK